MLAKKKKRRLKKLMVKNMNDLLNKKALWPIYMINKNKYGLKTVLKDMAVSDGVSFSNKDCGNSSFSFRSTPVALASDTVLVCHGQQKEFSDIKINNSRQWDFIVNETGAKVWQVIEALGVVNPRGSNNIIRRIEELENEAFRRKEVLKKSKKGFP